MVNIGTGNVLLQDDDMVVPHKGISLTFRRTYNSQSQHDVAGSDGTPASLYGNGWTNTFDAHLSGNPGNGTMSVWDVDGARYDYTGSDGAGWTPPAGQHASLVFDNSCGYLWTKKSGTTYYFNQTTDHPATCPYASARFGGYWGRLYEIIGRNRNVVLSFSYTWDGGNASPTGKINAITITTESGLRTAMQFADVAGHRLLGGITFPDGVTTVAYGYDTQGNLNNVSRPPNNAVGARPSHSYGYVTQGSGGSIISWADSPRWAAGGPDGGFTAFAFTGSTPATATLNAMARFANVNPVIADGTNAGAFQPGYPTSLYEYYDEFYATGVSTPTFRDTDGHAMNWVVDSAGRPTQTQECTATANSQCSGRWLVSNQTWDVANNLAIEVDPRGNETDYLYDPMGNTTAVGEPYTTTSQGSFKPTKLYDYDVFNNVVAYCDENETHAMQGDWTPATTSIWANDSLCASHSNVVPHWQAAFSYPASEPYGALQSMTTPLGYTRRFTYAAAQQSGADFGLATSVTGDPITQVDGTTVTPKQTFWYDSAGNIRCFDTGNGTWVLSYDALSRLTMSADPDDSSANSNSLCAKTGGQAGWSTQTNYTYYPDGELQYTESAVQHRADLASGTMNAAIAYTYDLDGNKVTETHHHGCATIAGCTAGVTTRWYDGADRLVEVMLPYDSQYDYHSYKWLTRYVYDLSGGGSQSLSAPGTSTTTAGTTQPFSAYGNLYDTQEYVDIGFSGNDSAPRWVDHLGTAYDAIDRQVMTFDIARSTSPLVRSLYDATPTTYGYLATRQKASGESITSDYDALGRLASVSFQNDGGMTPARQYSYDPSGHITSIASTGGTEAYAYDSDGRLLSKTEPANQGGNVVSYAYTPNGWRTSLSVTGALNETLFKYVYRADGELTQQLVNDNGWKSFAWTYTPSGRILTRTDPATGMTIHPAPYSPTGGTAFVQRVQAYSTNGTLASVVYSNGFSVNGITADLEGNPSSDSGDTTHQSLRNIYNSRGELSGAVTMSSSPPSGLLNVNANGVALRGLQPYPGPYVRGQFYGPYPDPQGQPNMLDGFELSRTGTDYSGGNGSASTYVTTNNYDASGRLLESGTAECPGDPNFPGFFNPNDNDEQFAYDAEDHTIKATTFGSTTSQPQSSCATVAGTTQIYNYVWGVNGHPTKLTSVNSYTTSEYLHWDGDTLLFTSSSPSSGVDDIKIASFGDLTSDGAIAIYDRRGDGVLVEAHSTFASTRNIPYNDSYSLGNASVLALCGVSFTQPCVVVTEPKPENLGGWPGVNVQGVRAVEPTLGHWTTPDAYGGDIRDPESQKPYMYELNNPYAYSDPTGFAPEDCHSSKACLKDRAGQSASPNDPCAKAVYYDACKLYHADGDLTEAMMNGVQVVIPGGEAVKSEDAAVWTWYLYQKLSGSGEHLKYGVTKNILSRYSKAELDGGVLKVLAKGAKNVMLGLERDAHKLLPIGREEAQKTYRAIQARMGFKLPPYKR